MPFLDAGYRADFHAAYSGAREQVVSPARDLIALACFVVVSPESSRGPSDRSCRCPSTLLRLARRFDAHSRRRAARCSPLCSGARWTTRPAEGPGGCPCRPRPSAASPGRVLPQSCAQAGVPALSSAYDGAGASLAAVGARRARATQGVVRCHVGPQGRPAHRRRGRRGARARRTAPPRARLRTGAGRANAAWVLACRAVPCLSALPRAGPGAGRTGVFAARVRGDRRGGSARPHPRKLYVLPPCCALVASVIGEEVAIAQRESDWAPTNPLLRGGAHA